MKISLENFILQILSLKKLQILKCHVYYILFTLLKKTDANKYNLPLAPLVPGGEELGETAVFPGYIKPLFYGLGWDSSVICTTGVPLTILLMNQNT